MEDVATKQSSVCSLNGPTGVAGVRAADVLYGARSRGRVVVRIGLSHGFGELIHDVIR